jgi:hypothetical protein
MEVIDFTGDTNEENLEIEKIESSQIERSFGKNIKFRNMSK